MTHHHPQYQNRQKKKKSETKEEPSTENCDDDILIEEIRDNDENKEEEKIPRNVGDDNHNPRIIFLEEVKNVVPLLISEVPAVPSYSDITSRVNHPTNRSNVPIRFPSLFSASRSLNYGPNRFSLRRNLHRIVRTFGFHSCYTRK